MNSPAGHVTLINTGTGAVAASKDLPTGFFLVDCPLVQLQPERAIGAERIRDELLRGRFDWLAFTSGAAVKFFFNWVREWDLIHALESLRLAVQGESSAAVLEELIGREPELVPERSLSDHFGKSLLECNPRSVLFPCATVTSGGFERILECGGVAVRCFRLYRTEPLSGGIDKLIELQATTSNDTVFLLSSPSAVEVLCERLDHGSICKARLASIGPVTSSAIVQRGFDVFCEAKQPGFELLVDEVVQRLRARSTDKSS